MSCHNCGRGFHDECITDCEICHPINDEDESVKKSLGASIKEPENVSDTESTGRKRAALLYPLFRSQPCEWRGKKNCGGGLNPIVGCIKGKQTHRHHGPIKNTLRNDPGNVHRICSPCHSRWHSKNDDVYSEEVYAEHPHRSEPASENELIINEARYRMKNKYYREDIEGDS